MAELVQGRTRDGRVWYPKFINSIDEKKCIGCARCFKACGRKVFAPVQVELEEDDDTRMVLSVFDGGGCIGCEACAKVCPNGCHTFNLVDGE